jgi:hypothetical protein
MFERRNGSGKVEHPIVKREQRHISAKRRLDLSFGRSLSFPRIVREQSYIQRPASRPRAENYWVPMIVQVWQDIPLPFFADLNFPADARARDELPAIAEILKGANTHFPDFALSLPTT